MLFIYVASSFTIKDDVSEMHMYLCWIELKGNSQREVKFFIIIFIRTVLLVRKCSWEVLTLTGVIQPCLCRLIPCRVYNLFIYSLKFWWVVYYLSHISKSKFVTAKSVKWVLSCESSSLWKRFIWIVTLLVGQSKWFNNQNSSYGLIIKTTALYMHHAF